jgi:thiol peroxidase
LLPERKNVVTVDGYPQTLLGEEIVPGKDAPAFTVIDQNLQQVYFNPAPNKIYLLNIVSSLETDVCDASTRRFNQEAANLGNEVEIWTISSDLPFTQARWCGAAGIDNVKVYSDYRDMNFARAYGVWIKETRLLARSIFVIDGFGKVTYVEYVKDISMHPDYERALDEVNKLI